MKKFFEEFKKFITRGNVVDMAVGVVVGGAFTAIVNGMTNNILKPLVNWIIFLALGGGSLSDCYTMLHGEPMLDEAGKQIMKDGKVVYDLAKSIYIDWGAFITAVINFFIIAFVLFCIVKFINSVRENSEKMKQKAGKYRLTREQRAELKIAGIRPSNRAAVKEYFEIKEKNRLEEEARLAKEAEEKAIADRLANPTTEDLLKQIVQLLSENKQA